MKNKFSKRAHISEAKFKLILKMFCAEKTAVEISAITGISRITVNKYLGDIRNMILTCDDLLLEQKANALFADEFSKLEKQKEKQLGAPHMVSMAGVEVEGSKLRVHPVRSKVERIRVLRIAQGKISDHKEQELAKRFCGFVDLENRKFYEVDGRIARRKNAKEVKENTDRFWNIFKNRLIKSKGLADNTIYLHLKESELRANYGKAEMYSMLLKVMRRRHLHIDRAA